MSHISTYNCEDDFYIEDIAMITSISRDTSVYCKRIPRNEDLLIKIIDRENIEVLHKLKRVNVNLRNQDAIDGLIQLIDSTKKVMLDITFLPINVWAVILRRLLILDRNHSVMYKSSDNYENLDAGETIEEFHISDDIEGIFPLPGFYRLARPKLGQSKIFIPILGFQGSRVQHITNKEIEEDYLVFPLLGVPGIRSDYGRISLFQNREIITQQGVYRNIRYYSAWSPFEVISEMNKIIDGRGDLFLKIAPLGSKPSALGAIIFTMQCEKRGGVTANIIFDHPKVPDDFSRRNGSLYVYDTYGFWKK